MNYTQITSSAMRYADKQDDTDIQGMIDVFLPIVEGRINRAIQVAGMTTQATLPLFANQQLYGLPSDFLGLRDIEISTDEAATNRQTLQYMSPEQMNNHVKNKMQTPAYTLIAQQVHVYPTIDDTLLTIVYYQRLPPLTEKNSSNWVSEINPDAYIFGLLVEISSFLKDDQAAQMWQGRFAAAVEDMKNEDDNSRWSGTALQIRTG